MAMLIFVLGVEEYNVGWIYDAHEWAGLAELSDGPISLATGLHIPSSPHRMGCINFAVLHLLHRMHVRGTEALPDSNRMMHNGNARP
jgi:hypothetical protein